MSKSSKGQIEQDEKKILSELVKNSKENIETIAKHCGFSRQKTWRFIKQLEEKGLIWGYTAIFNEQKIGLNHFILMLKRTTKPLKEGTADRIISRRAEDILKKLEGTIETSTYVHGDYDWVVTFTANDIKQAKKYSDALIALHPGEIEKVTLLQTMMFVKKQYILNPERKKLKEFI
jgi:DNA-binding Lrp family transcriptional regulator